MKKSISLFLSLTVLGVTSAFAAPVYYTFTGELASIHRDDAGIAADLGLARGDAVTYVFMIDKDLPGTYITNNGTEYLQETRPGRPITHIFFYADHISGALLQEKDGGYYNQPYNIAEYNYLSESVDPLWQS